MTTITIELEDEKAEQLAAKAQHKQVTLEEYTKSWVLELLNKPDDDFNQLVQRIIEEDKELLRRLA